MLYMYFCIVCVHNIHKKTTCYYIMDIKRHFFSSNNLNDLTDRLGNLLELSDNPDAYDGCQDLLKSQMSYVFEKNKGILNKAPPQKILKQLNEKSIELCEKIYINGMKKKTQSKSLGQYSMDRESEIHGNRRNRVQKQGRFDRIRRPRAGKDCAS